VPKNKVLIYEGGGKGKKKEACGGRGEGIRRAREGFITEEKELLLKRGGRSVVLDSGGGMEGVTKPRRNMTFRKDVQCSRSTRKEGRGFSPCPA